MYGWGGSGVVGFPFWGTFAVLFALWSLFWKGMALWKAARNGEKYWFIGLLFINTLGLLEILYIFFFTSGEKGLPNLTVSTAPSAKAKSRAKKTK